jgi:hypothetical protein
LAEWVRMRVRVYWRGVAGRGNHDGQQFEMQEEPMRPWQADACS